MSPDLTSYDIILVNSSAGKDSQAMLDLIVEGATEAAVLDRIVVVHCDLGRVEWDGTRDLAEAQAKHYGLRFIAVSRPQGDLLDQVEARGMWPSSQARYCTSDQKTSQVLKVMTKLVAERHWRHSPVRILNCLGLRAEESKARAKKPEFSVDRATNGKRHVDRWHPIHHWRVAQVWERIHASGVPYHPAYDQGMPRLSCSFCVLSSKSALVRAAQLRPEMAQTYLGVEERINHRFRQDLSMADIIAAAGRQATAEPILDWAA